MDPFSAFKYCSADKKDTHSFVSARILLLLEKQGRHQENEIQK
jgi:hypothetical protein